MSMEQKKTTSEPGPETRALLELLGRVDATFWPPRAERHDPCWYQVVFERQKDWRDGRGLPLRTSGANTTERKRDEQLWRRLERSALVTISRSSGRRTHVKFTPTGEAIVRVLAGTGSVVTEWQYFARFMELAPRYGRHGQSLSEAFVADAVPWTGSEAQSKQLTVSMLRLVPFLTAGWITAWPDSVCRYWLSATPEGREAFEAGTPVDLCPADVKLSEPASEVYERAFLDGQCELARAKPRNNNAVCVALPCGISWGYEPDETST